MRRALKDRVIAVLVMISLVIACAPGADKEPEHTYKERTSDKPQVKTLRPQKGSRFSTITVPGIINYNTNNLQSISSRVSGRVERLYIRYNYQQVSKGQKLMDIYSPDLVNAQQELLFLKKSGDITLMEAAKRKLRLLGATNQQIRSLLGTGKVDYTFSIYSPYSGYVADVQSTGGTPQGSGFAGTALISESGGGDEGMGGMGSSPSDNSNQVPTVNSNTPVLIREGQYVSAGQKLFGLASMNSVWAEFFVSPAQLKEFKNGTSLEIEDAADSSNKVKATVSLIQPYYKESSSFSLVRAVIDNPGREWKVGQLLNVTKGKSKIEGNWLPREAVFETGTRYVVFENHDGTFKPRFIAIKGKSGDWINVGDELGTDTEVAANAWFLADSESFIK
ncbi:efflux RND transporter periplasmic adaptor subunit [Desertivirga xinjiangensis]|uniref:efflux RND transporter periplasmic adaptor subunit n=1 Tax=Desertivirga xinjiangensis TaxID=539206 RepID=UPI00210EB2BA|nr:efflux RND transporter periplasmic adaptor subunit [Pedobacter xinjiangensis]